MMNIEDVLNNIDAEVNHFGELYPELYENADNQYYTIDTFNQKFPENSDDLSIFHCNIRSFKSNGDDLCIFLSNLNHKFQIICLNETFIKDTDLEFQQFDDYKIFHSTRVGRKGGGTALLIKKSFDCEIIPENSVNLPFIESIFVKIRLPNSNPIIIGSIYRPPGSSFPDFLNFMEQTLSSTTIGNYDKILLGDYNLDLLKINEDNQSSNFYNSMNALSLIPTIMNPTRETNSSSTIIDNILISNLQNFSAGIFKFDLSDHYPIFIIYPKYIQTTQKPPTKISYRIVNDLALHKISEALRADIYSGLFDPNSTNVNFAFQLLHDRILLHYNLFCPILTKFVSPKYFAKPWINSTVRSYIKKREAYFHLFKRGCVTRPQYNSFRNFVTNIIKASKKNYYLTAFDQVKSDIKKTWKKINNILSSGKSNSKKNSIDEIVIDNNTITSKQDIADALNEHFSTIGDKIATSIQHHAHNPVTPWNNINQSKFSFSLVTPCIVEKIIMSQKNKKSNLYCYSIGVLKHLSPMIAPVLTKFINLSLINGSFPDFLKTASVTPIYKSGSKTDVCNYRPISILSIFSKIFEKIIAFQLTNYCDKNNIFTTAQYGFRKGKSTSDALLDTLQYVYDNLDKNKTVISFFSGFFKSIRLR